MPSKNLLPLFGDTNFYEIIFWPVFAMQKGVEKILRRFLRCKIALNNFLMVFCDTKVGKIIMRRVFAVQMLVKKLFGLFL